MCRYTHLYTCLYIYAYVCICICVYIYTYNDTSMNCYGMTEYIIVDYDRVYDALIYYSIS